MTYPFEVEVGLNRWMLFVDGENLTIRGQRLAKDEGVALTSGPYYEPDVFVWTAQYDPQGVLRELVQLPGIIPVPIRSYYYTSVMGDEDAITDVRKRLRGIGFQPQVFKRLKDQKASKGVDITLAKDMLSHAFSQNYDVAVLFAGDGDFLPLVEEVQRQGKVVVVSFFEKQGLSEQLRLVADHFLPLDSQFLTRWDEYSWPIKGARKFSHPERGHGQVDLVCRRASGGHEPDRPSLIRFTFHGKIRQAPYSLEKRVDELSIEELLSFDQEASELDDG